jgi:hypothetical protein
LGKGWRFTRAVKANFREGHNGKGTTSVVPLSRLKPTALQRLRFDLGVGVMLSATVFKLHNFER